jgi:hypothetical protein
MAHFGGSVFLRISATAHQLQVIHSFSGRQLTLVFKNDFPVKWCKTALPSCIQKWCISLIWCAIPCKGNAEVGLVTINFDSHENAKLLKVVFQE